MASGAEHEVEIAERDRLLAALETPSDTPAPLWVTLQTRGRTPKETIEVHLNAALVESITDTTSPAEASWITLNRKR